MSYRLVAPVDLDGHPVPVVAGADLLVRQPEHRHRYNHSHPGPGLPLDVLLAEALPPAVAVRLARVPEWHSYPDHLPRVRHRGHHARITVAVHVAVVPDLRHGLAEVVGGAARVAVLVARVEDARAARGVQPRARPAAAHPTGAALRPPRGRLGLTGGGVVEDRGGPRGVLHHRGRPRVARAGGRERGRGGRHGGGLGAELRDVRGGAPPLVRVGHQPRPLALGPRVSGGWRLRGHVHQGVASLNTLNMEDENMRKQKYETRKIWIFNEITMNY